jgi:hypothetical protein
MKTLRQSWNSIVYFVNLIFTWSLHTNDQHLWNTYRVSDKKTYAVFRETDSDKEYGEKEVTLIIGFHLKFIGKNRFFSLAVSKFVRTRYTNLGRVQGLQNKILDG